jgi:hypothetical protein
VSLFVAPYPTTDLADFPRRGYDALICTLGFESRSRALAEQLVTISSRPQIHAAAFEHRHDQSYVTNREVVEGIGAEILEFDDEEFRQWAVDWVAGTDHRCVAIDISSMSRPRIAALVEAIQCSARPELQVDFLYVPQIYQGPPPPSEAPTALGPVSPAFAGWDADIEEPVVIIFGLGYEPIRAAAAIDALEPQLAVPFFPIGSDLAFVKDVEQANAEILNLESQGVTPARRYRIDDPFTCFAELDALLSKYLEREGARPLLLPLGPKIFALVCLLASAVHDPAVPVWRASAGQLEDPVDQIGEDTLVTLRVSASPIAPPEDA